MLKHGILGLLSYSDMTGYEIKAVFEDSLKYFWHAQTSQIYRELQALEKNGWISATHVAQEGRPDKNVLSITEKGRIELMDWLNRENESCMVRNPILMKTFFRGECGIEENINFFKKVPETECVIGEIDAEIIEKVNEYKSSVDDPLKALYWKFTMDYGVMYGKMVREWCKSCIKQLEEVRDSTRK